MTQYNDERQDWAEFYKDLNVEFTRVKGKDLFDPALLVRNLYNRTKGFFSLSESEAKERIVITVNATARKVQIGIRPPKGRIISYSDLSKALENGLTLSIKF